jgi:hypothetical protein
MSGPPGWVERPSGGPYARWGSWQVAQDIFPEAESVGSEKSARPSSVIAAGEGLRLKVVA